MKFITQISKELIITSRGFYFYTELLITVIVLLIMLFLVPSEKVSSKEEYLFYNMKPEISRMIFEKSIEKGVMEKSDDKTFILEPAEIKLFPDRDTVPNQFDNIVYPFDKEFEKLKKTKNDDGSYSFVFDDQKEITGVGYAIYDKKGGRLDKHVYLFNSFEDVLRLSRAKRNTGGIIYYDKENRENYEIFFPGVVTEKFKNATYALHNDNIYDVIDEAEEQKVRYLGK